MAQFTANIDLSTLDGSTGFKLSGGAVGDVSGLSVASAGDINGDGFADLIVGAPLAGYGDLGVSYVVFGKASGLAPNIDLSTLDGTSGFRLSGAFAFDHSGISVASAGDVNGDGFADLIIGAFHADPHGDNSGASYVVFGQLPDTAVNRTGTAASQTLAGGDFNDTLSGLGGDDTLHGNGGNDTLDGGAGDDAMIGGLGNDVYIVDSASDVITEAANAGTDEVQTVLASYTLAVNVENLTGTAASGQHLTGNALANTIIGGIGNDTIEGGGSSDTLAGGAGNDVYLIDSLGVTVTEAATAGTDEVRTALASFSLAANVENLTGTALGEQALTGNAIDNVIAGGDFNDTLLGLGSDDTLHGNGGDDTLIGGTGDDTLTGGTGDDTMVGGTGNDVYIVDSLGDILTEAASAGTDEVRTALASYSLAGIANVEILTGTAPGRQALTGNALDNVIAGGAGGDTLDGGSGNDTLIGGTGDDTMFGGQGNDSYRVDSANDVVTETAGGGYDIVVATADYTLPANVEALYLKGTGLTGTGSAGADTLLSARSGGTNTLVGLGGDDLYYVSHTGDTVTETAGGGYDTVVATADYTLPANVEALHLTGTGLIGTGSGGADTLLSAPNGGANILIGLGGNDLYYINHAGDSVIETAGDGYDTVVAAVDYSLPADVEALYMNGAGLTGTGSAGADMLLSIGGANTLVGLGGDDLYYVNHSGDSVTETAGGGYDTVTATADYTLPADVEALCMNGSGLTGTGSAGADTLLSAAGGGANTLIGLGGDDLYCVNHSGDSVTETAGGGYDTVLATVDYTMPANVEALYLIGTGLTGTGSAGDDTLISVGANTLAGLAGNDTFVFLSSEANGAAVVDFDGLGAAQGDTLIFSGFGSAAQGASFTSLGHDQWQIHSGLDAHNETITLGNGASIHVTDFLFV